MASTYKYSYPNYKSYQMIPPRPGVGLYNGQLLRHGYIYGYKKVSATTTATTPPGGPDAARAYFTTPSYRQIDWQSAMVFQFNPVHLPISVSLMLTDSQDQAAPGGNLPTPSVGLAKSNLQLFFDRSNEIARATMARPDRAGQSKYRDLGVQCDLFDFLRVISGGDDSVLGGKYTDPADPDSPYAAPVQRDSINRLTGMLVDAVVAGPNLAMTPFAIVFNQNLAVNVSRLNSFTFDFVRFTADLVPTTVQIDMELEITNLGTKVHATSGQGAAATMDPTTGPPGTNDVSAAASSVITSTGLI